jgi:hypothetical protein
MERYLYFTTTTGTLDNNAEVAMYPTSSVTAINAASATTTRINMVPRDWAGTTEDVVTLTHIDGDHKNVMTALVAIINAEKNNNPFAVVADEFNGIFNITGVTNCAVVSAD